MIFHANRLLQTILMKYQTFIFFEELGKLLQNLSFAADVTGALICLFV